MYELYQAINRVQEPSQSDVSVEATTTTNVDLIIILYILLFLSIYFRFISSY